MAELEHTSPLCLGVLASHAGTNFQSILDRCLTGEIPAHVGVVISNNSHSGAIRRAQSLGIPTQHLSTVTHPDPKTLDQAIVKTLQSCGVHLVVLAGYMKKLGSSLLSTFDQRVINIHPSLLPSFGGQGMYGRRVHEAVLRAGCAVTGATVHLVDGEYDRGRIIAQKIVPVMPNDTPDVLAKRVLKTEHILYPSVIRQWALGQIRVDDGGN